MKNTNIFKFLSISLLIYPLLSSAMEQPTVFKGETGLSNFFNIFSQQQQNSIVQQGSPSNQQQINQPNNQSQLTKKSKKASKKNKVKKSLVISKKDGDLGKDPRFLFEDTVLEKINSKDIEGLCSFLDKNPGKRIDFRHYHSHQEPLTQASKNKTMCLALENYQKQAEEYQDNLFSLIKSGTSKELSIFLSNHQGYDIDFLYKLSAKTSLEYAVSLNDIEKANILKQAGAKLDQGIHSRPLLLIALMNDNKKMLEYLTQYCCFNNYKNLDSDGIDINFHDSEFFWPHIYPDAKISQEMRKELYKLFDKIIYKGCKPQDELLHAACIGRTILLDRALSKGAQVNNYGIALSNDVALNLACSKARIDAIAHLIKCKADVNMQDKLKGRSALHWVVRMHKKAKQKSARYMSSSELLPCSFLLMCAGADPEIKDKREKSVRDWVNELSVNDEEKSLLIRILNIPQLNKEQRAALLGDIYNFQVKELREYISCENIPVPLSSGARYFWHRPECIRMKNAWVIEHKEDYKQGTTSDFKDIYKKALKQSIK